MNAKNEPSCRICGAAVRECLDLGRQPVSNGYLRPQDVGRENFYHLKVGICTSCTMVQQLEELPREWMFGAEYPYRSSLSSVMTEHFRRAARRFLETELTGEDPFVVEIGSNDGILLETISAAGVRHLGVDPSAEAADLALDKGIRVHVEFFDESSAAAVRATEGPADLIFSANTFSHISYMDSVWAGLDALLAPNGVFVVEDRYLGDIVASTIFDQIYDEHFYLFAVRSVRALAAHFGFELVDVEHLPVHGGSFRYTIARPGARRPSAAVGEAVAREGELGLADESTFHRFAANIDGICTDLVGLLHELRDAGKRVVGYGATAKSATLTSYAGIGTDLVPYIVDSTPEKQGRFMPGSHIPIRSIDEFAEPYPDYAVLFAWSHAEEVIAKERAFADAGGRWISYVPKVHII